MVWSEVSEIAFLYLNGESFMLYRTKCRTYTAKENTQKMVQPISQIQNKDISYHDLKGIPR